jgi:hypothetical protein
VLPGFGDVRDVKFERRRQTKARVRVTLGRPGGLAAAADRRGIRRQVFAAEKIHGDDAPIPVLEPGLGRTDRATEVYVRDDRPFCGTAPPAVAYVYSPDRHRSGSGRRSTPSTLANLDLSPWNWTPARAKLTA